MKLCKCENSPFYELKMPVHKNYPFSTTVSISKTQQEGTAVCCFPAVDIAHSFPFDFAILFLPKLSKMKLPGQNHKWKERWLMIVAIVYVPLSFESPLICFTLSFSQFPSSPIHTQHAVFDKHHRIAQQIHLHRTIYTLKARQYPRLLDKTQPWISQP